MSAAPPAVVIDSHGRRLRLGRLLGQGGEGAVFDVEDRPGLAAKIHHQPLTPLRADKIRAMAAMRTASVDDVAAWPIDILALPSGAPIGLTIPKLDGYTAIHSLCCPKSRRRAFPEADWRLQIQVTINLCRAVRAIHDLSGVVADINHGGVLVDHGGGVRLIDCDSFQVRDGSKTYLCDVGVAAFTPPELQGLLFSEIVRTPNHDNFGLAVLIFLTLFMGRHPFAGRYSGPNDMPIERAIGECRFAYGADSSSRQIERPPGAPPLGIVSPAVAGLFERSFAREGRNGVRPTPDEWAGALQALGGDVRQCAFSAAHWHFAGLSSCPWCRMEAATGVALYLPPESSSVAPRLFDMEAFIRDVDAIEAPGAAPALDPPPPDRKAAPSPAAVEFRRKRRIQQSYALMMSFMLIPLSAMLSLPLLGRVFFVLAAVLLYVVARKIVRAANDTSQFAERARLDLESFEKSRDQWQRQAGPGRFDSKRAELDELRAEWFNLREGRSGNPVAALDRVLDGLSLDSAGATAIGPARVALLESFGIETAADLVERKLRIVPRLEPQIYQALVDWRRALEAHLRTNGIGERAEPDGAMSEREARMERLRIESALRCGLQDLEILRREIASERVSLKPAVEEAHRTCLQSAIDLEAVSR